ncbi:MAG TPA: hypothetical protein VFH08_03400, partial [Chitinophagaceae bacterium]|nr:hypothetical protein [Chitinophagaceae bacterium]
KIADANVDITIETPINHSMLNGYITSIGTVITSSSWKQISGPAAYIHNPQALQSKVSNLDVIGVYEFELTVLDNTNHFDKDTMTLRVEDATSNNNQIFLWDVRWTANSTGFDELHIDIDNFYYFVPTNTPFEIFIKRAASSAWEEVMPSTQSNGSARYVYYLGSTLNAVLRIYEIPEVTTNDKPDIKIVY